MTDTMGFRFVGDAATDPTSNDFAMYSPEGNVVVAKVVGLVSMFVSQMDAETLSSVLTGALAEIAKTHGEVGDTMVKETIFSALEAQWLMIFGETETLASVWS